METTMTTTNIAAPTASLGIPKTMPLRELTTFAGLLPKITPEYIKEYYPSYLKLVNVQVFHRHGERTPVSYQPTSYAPKQWDFCREANKFHSEFLRSVGQFTRHPDAPVESNIAKWQGFTFPATLQAAKQEREQQQQQQQQQTASKHEKQGDSTEWRESTCAWGQLTDVGRESMKRVGRFLRSLYIDQLQFMPARAPSDGSLYLRSSEYTRTIESINMLVSGLYPTTATDGSLKHLRLHIRPKQLDNLPLLYSAQWVARMMPEAQRRARAIYSGFIDAVYDEAVGLRTLGRDIEEQLRHNSIVPYHFVYDTLIAMKAHGVPMRPTGKEEDELTPELLGRIGQVVFTDMAFSKRVYPEYAYLQNQGVAKLVASNVMDAVATDSRGGRAAKQMEVYSGHDTTIAPLLLTLGDDETAQGLEPINITWPPFSSTVRIETFRDDSVSGGGNSNDGGDGLKQISGIVGKVPAGLESMMSKYFVRVHYMDRLVQLPACQKPGNHHPKMGSQLCTLDAFLKQVASILPEKTVQQGSSSLVVTSGPKEDEVAESRGGNGSGNLSLV